MTPPPSPAAPLTKELKPCPFCGSKAGTFGWKDHYGCTNEDCGAHAANLTADQWNRRESLAPQSLKESEGRVPCDDLKLPFRAECIYTSNTEPEGYAGIFDATGREIAQVAVYGTALDIVALCNANHYEQIAQYEQTLAKLSVDLLIARRALVSPVSGEPWESLAKGHEAVARLRGEEIERITAHLVSTGPRVSGVEQSLEAETTNSHEKPVK